MNYKPLNDEVGEEHRRRAAQKLKELEAKLQADAEEKRRSAAATPAAACQRQPVLHGTACLATVRHGDSSSNSESPT